MAASPPAQTTSQAVRAAGDLSCPHTVPRPLVEQDWRFLSFLHWRYEPDAVSRLLPAGVTLDTFDGSAWVSLVPFLLRLRVPHGPAAPWLGVFPETNVRTYVHGPDGTPGVWFLSLDAPRRLTIWAARRTYHLPYHVATMSLRHTGNTCAYAGVRLSGSRSGASSGAHVTLLERLAPWDVTALDVFLTARWNLFAPLREGIGGARVEHAPYRLWRASATEVDAGVFVAAGLPNPVGRPLVHGCDDVRAAMSRLTRCETRGPGSE